MQTNFKQDRQTDGSSKLHTELVIGTRNLHKNFQLSILNGSQGNQIPPDRYKRTDK